MAADEKNFGKKINTGGFAANPQNINRTGANRKSFSKINEALKKKGIKPVSKTELVEFYALVFNATEDELKRIRGDQKTPYMLRLIIDELGNKKTQSKAISDFREFIFGKAAQEISHDVTVKARVLTPQELKDHLEKLNEDY